MTLEVSPAVLETVKGYIRDWMSSFPTADDLWHISWRGSEPRHSVWYLLSTKGVDRSLLASKRTLWDEGGANVRSFTLALINTLRDDIEARGAVGIVATTPPAVPGALVATVDTVVAPDMVAAEAGAGAGGAEEIVAGAEPDAGGVAGAEAEPETGAEVEEMVDAGAEEIAAEPEEIVAGAETEPGAGAGGVAAEMVEPGAVAVAVVVSKTPLTLDQKRVMLADPVSWAGYASTFGFSSPHGVECYNSCRDLVSLQVRIEDMRLDLEAKEIAWHEQHGAEKVRSDRVKYATIDTQLRDLISGGVTGLTSLLESNAAKLEALGRVASASDVGLVRRFVLGSTAEPSTPKFKKFKRKVKCAPTRPSSPVIVPDSEILKIRSRLEELEKDAGPLGTVFGVRNARQVACTCSKCSSEFASPSLSPCVTHMWAALSVDGTFDSENSGVWECHTKAHGEPLGPRCLGKGSSVIKKGALKYPSKISDVFFRVFGREGLNSDVRGANDSYPYNFFVHHHRDMMSPDNKVFLLVPQCCESEQLFETRFPGYSSSSGTYFANVERTKDPKVFCEKMYGKLGWDEKDRPRHRETLESRTIWCPESAYYKKKEARGKKRSATGEAKAGPSNAGPSHAGPSNAGPSHGAATDSDTESES